MKFKEKFKNFIKDDRVHFAIFMILLYLALSLFWISGYKYGKEHSDNIKASADVDSDDYDAGYTYIPLDFQTSFAFYSNSLLDWVESTGINVFNNKYFIYKQGSSWWSIGEYGDTLDFLNEVYDLNPNGDNITYNGTGTFYNFNNSSYITYTYSMYPTDADYIFTDFVNFEDISLRKIEFYNNFYTSDLDELYTNYSDSLIFLRLVFEDDVGGENDIDIGVKLTAVNFSTPTNYCIFYTPQSMSTIKTYQVNIDNYQLGYDQGLWAGQHAPNNYSYNQGYAEGYDIGFTEGSSTNNGNTLRSVIVAGIETPVNMFRTMTNWEFLGFNLFGLFCVILTIVVLIYVVKMLR